MANYVFKIRLILWLILFFAIGLFFYFKIVPAGRISYANDFKKKNYFIGKFTPAERVGAGESEVVIKGDPVYFSLKTPRRFTRADISLKFRNTTAFPIMELGLLNDKVSWSYDLQPLENKIIDQLALVWSEVGGSSGARLIEREENYDSIEKFLNKLPEIGTIALYDYSLKDNYLIKDYLPRAEEKKIDCGFRGSYQFYTYIKNEKLDYTFDFSDLNINKDDDSIDIRVYSPTDGLIYSGRIQDENSAAPKRQANISIADLKEGVYRLSFTANDDIVTNKIISRQSYFAIINKIWLVQNGKNSFIIYTNSRLLNAQTSNPGSLGKIKVGDYDLNLAETYKQYTYKIPYFDSEESGAENQKSKAIKIESAKGDIVISGDGVFGFSPAALIDPRFKKVSGNLDINREKINYILTNYRQPEVSGEWQSARVSFDLTKAYQENGKYQFLLSIPGLKAEEPAAGSVLVKDIKIDLSGVSLWQKINKFISR